MTTIEELKRQKRWVCYDASKAPIDATTGKFASTTDPATWTTYDLAASRVKPLRCQGVGMVFLPDDDIVGIDLDDCVTEELGEDFTPVYRQAGYARHLMAQSTSYAELSPSRTGIHIIGTGTIPRSLKQKVNGIGVEIYDRARYFTFTELPISEDDNTLSSVQGIIDEVFFHIEEPAPQPVPDPLPIAGQTSDAWAKSVIDRRIEAAKRMIENAPDGFRHSQRFAAGRLLGGYLEAADRAGHRSMSDDEAIRTLYDCRVPAKGAERKERQAIADGLRSGRQNPVTFPKPPEDVPPPPKHPKSSPVEAPGAMENHFGDDDTTLKNRAFTDVGNAHRLVRFVDGKVCYVPEWKAWLEWDGRRWARIDAQLVKRKAHEMVLEMYREAATHGISSELAKWAIKSDASPRIDAMITEAQPYLIINAHRFDTDPALLNCGDCVVNLRTGGILDHHPDLRMTKLVDVPYRNYDGISQRWSQFLQTVFRNDDELIAYIQRAVGYTLTGMTDEHCLFFCYGDGANGKSTFMRAMSIILGDYATTSSIEALLDHRQDGEGATPMVAALQGKRFAMASEMPEGRRLNESRVKDLTGGDDVVARVLYGSPFVFRPTHTLWITGNHKPKISGTDSGIWRRLRIVPFVANIPADKRRDPRDLEREFREDASAILSWAVTGATLWFQNGLRTCRAVETATNDYRGEEDIVARFLSTMCVLGEDKTARKSELYAAWKEWAEDEGERDASRKSQRWLTTQLITRGMRDDRTHVIGLGVKTERYETAHNVTPLPTRGQLRRGEMQ